MDQPLIIYISQDPQKDPVEAFDYYLKNSVNVFALDYPAEAYYIMILANEFSTGVLNDLLFELEVE